MMHAERLGNSIMGLASASELQTLISSFIAQYADYFIAFNSIRSTEIETSYILISEPVHVTYMYSYVYLYNSSLFISIHL
jgi:hypothetical protein